MSYTFKDGELRRLQLGFHAARAAARAGAAGQRKDLLVDAVDLRDQTGGGAEARVAVIQPVNIR